MSARVDHQQPAAMLPVRTTSRWDVLTRLVRKKTALLGIVLSGLVILTAIFAPLIAPHDPYQIQMQTRLQNPSGEFWMGTDELGRDVFSRIMFGARVSIAVGVVSILIAFVVGVSLGLASGFYGGRLDSVVMRTMDALAAFPAMLLALAILSALGPGILNAMIAIGISFLPAFSRLTRGNTLSVKENEYVEAARACGASNVRIMFKTVLPNCLAPVLVHASIGFANAIIIEAGLSFLGLGTQPPTPSWGAMLDEARQYMNQTVWYSIAAGMAIFLSVLGLNLVGDGLRDVLDPRLRGG